MICGSFRYTANILFVPFISGYFILLKRADRDEGAQPDRKGAVAADGASA
jgi:hypothetical protein